MSLGIMTPPKKRLVEFLDDVSSDEDDYYESQRKKALLDPSTKQNSTRVSSPTELNLPDFGAASASSSMNNPFLEEREESGDEEANEPGKSPDPANEEEEMEDEATVPLVLPLPAPVAPARTPCTYGATCYRYILKHAKTEHG